MKWKHVVLAAGRSSRMGFPKARIHLRGETVVEGIVRRGLEAGAGRSLVVVGYHETRVRRALNRYRGRIRFVRNPDPTADQTGSMKCALRADGVEWPVIMQPVDNPLIPVNLLRRLVDAPADRIRIPALDDRRGHPPLFPPWFLEEILHMPPDSGIRGLYDRYEHRIESVSCEEWAVLTDLDTPGDLRRLRTRIRAAGR